MHAATVAGNMAKNSLHYAATMCMKKCILRLDALCFVMMPAGHLVTVNVGGTQSGMSYAGLQRR